MSDNILDADDMFDESAGTAGEIANEIGMTSDESSGDSDAAETTEKKSFLGKFSVFDSMLLVALICISLATLVMFLELNTFGKFPGTFPWRVSDFVTK